MFHTELAFLAPANASQRPGSDDRDISETSTVPTPPLTAANISVHQKGLGETPQNPVALAKRPFITTGPTIRLDESAQASTAYDSRGNVSYERLADPRLADALRDDRLKPVESLTLDTQFDERPLLARSTSLEVHVPSPIPQDEQLESPTAFVELDLEGPQDLKSLASFGSESSLAIVNPTRRHSFAETATSSSSGFVLLAPQVSSNDSRPSSVPARQVEPWQLVRNPAVFIPSPHLMTIEETLIDQLEQPCPRLDLSPISQHKTLEHGGAVNYSRPLSVASGGISSARPLPPRIGASKYPPCWTTDDGLLIVPSVPGELVKGKAQHFGEYEMSETTSSTQIKHANPSNANNTADDLVEVAALSPNVTTYRKANCPRRKRSPSYYDPDILPHQKIAHVI